MDLAGTQQQNLTTGQQAIGDLERQPGSSVEKLPCEPIMEEELRLSALHSYRLLDGPRLAVFDDIAQLAAAIFRTPMSAVSLVDKDRQWFAGKVGLTTDQISRDMPFCAYAVATRKSLIVPDAHAHPVFPHLSTVSACSHIRFYAGAPIFDEDGYALGTVYVLDGRPRAVGAEQHEMLVKLASQASTHLAGIRSKLLLADLSAEVSRAAIREEDLVATISHELRTPVASILGYIELLVDQESSGTYRRFTEPIQRNGARLVRTVEDLLAGSRSADALEPAFLTPVNLAAVAEAAAARCVQQFPDRASAISIVLTDRNCTVSGNFTQLTHAVEQLIRNALLFSTTASPVQITVSGGSRPGIEVVDQGVGIPVDELPLITQRFYRGRHARHAATAGMGLGLTIAHTVARAHAGSLTVASAGPAAGTTAQLEFPERPTFAPMNDCAED